MKKFAAHLLGLFCSASFAQQADRTQHPAEDARWTTLIVQAQQGLEPQPITLQYESRKCKESRAYGVGGQSQSGSMQMPALSFEKPQWVKSAQSHEYKIRFAVDGGGPCQWQLQYFEFRLQYQSSNPLVKGQQAESARIRIEFRKDRAALRRSNVRMALDYFPVIVMDADAAKNQLKLRPKTLLMLPSFDPPESGVMLLQAKVFEDMALTARKSSENRYDYVLNYPDGSTGKASSQDTIGVDDSRMQCLLETGKSKCSKYPADQD